LMSLKFAYVVVIEIPYWKIADRTTTAPPVFSPFFFHVVIEFFRFFFKWFSNLQLLRFIPGPVRRHTNVNSCASI
jgi:hypothetical protein